MPPMVRRAPLSERLRAYLDMWDWILWISEEINGSDWEEFAEGSATTIGIALNVIFMIARSWSGEARPSARDDVFGDFEGRSGTGWLVWFFSSIVYTLSVLSFANAAYTFTRTKSYRLFERPVETEISTPSARRVRVDSAPLSSSPFRAFSSAFTTTSARSRSHPDNTRDVWELLVWDPTPICLRLFCLLSPGHIIVYWLFLPTAKMDPQPSVTVVKTIFLTTILSLQLHFLRHNFVQQTTDNKIVHGEVLHEYDQKFVHPILNRPVRDVAVQTPPPADPETTTVSTSEVDVYTPTTILKRGFHTHPNPAYASQYDPDNVSSLPQPSYNTRSVATSSVQTPPTNYAQIPSSVTVGTDLVSSPLRSRQVNPQHNQMRQPRFRQSDVGTGGGGSLGVYSHAASPLRKAASTNYLREEVSDRERRREQSPVKRHGSPLKRMSTPGGLERGGIAGPNFVQPKFSSRDGNDSSRKQSGLF